MKTKSISLGILATFLVFASIVWAHEPVKLTGYVGDVVCATDHINDKAEDATKFSAEHTKSCGLMDECVKSGYAIFSDGKWYPFDAKGNELAKALIEKTRKSDHIKATVEGMKHDGKILVEKITEVE
jgi:hypothetical protein